METNQPLLYRAFFQDADGVGVTGLTVTVDVYDGDGSLIVNNQAATEIAGGFYKYDVAASLNTDAGEYLALFKTASTSVRDRQLPALISVIQYRDTTLPTMIPNDP